jgi:hypothetical protein
VKDPNHTLLEVVNHILTLHPNLAPAVEEIALMIQGRDQTTLQRREQEARQAQQAQQAHQAREAQLFQGLDTQGIFTKIYSERLWGHSGRPEHRFWSGSGSHVDAIVRPYLSAVTAFLAALGDKPDVVDLGCGDFAVGAQLRPHCAGYVACDIVAPLIEHNRDHFRSLEVDFRLLNIAADPLPHGGVAMIRQVLQHLSNDEILGVVRQVEQRFRYLVLTEHLPAAPDFPPNLDKPTGRDIRMTLGSGIVLTAAPFNLRPLDECVLCEAAEAGGVIRTTLYQLA